MKSLDNRRLIRCPACNHQGTVAKKVKTTAIMECTACKVKVMLRFCIVGENGTCCRWRPPSPAKTSKDAAARDALRRYTNDGDLPDDGDTLANLWRGG